MRLNQAHKDYKEAKKNTVKWCTEFQETYIVPKVRDRGVTEEIVTK